ncbi:unnamed protein product [Euphydryas editha]|uniref:Uncharacterized protein n=1 Tax=Euphydryas editha TaxID=104508 RepID=A0AAU9TZI9_EUPED|nr:unnamed protein product [Euphydryas editha]
MAFLKQFFASLPKMPSHYCRAMGRHGIAFACNRESKQYLEPIIADKTMLYTLYAMECQKSEKIALSRWTLCRVFDELNLSLFTPKKDQFDTCCSHKVGNITDDIYNRHIRSKNMARNKKAMDKDRAQKIWRCTRFRA